MNSRKSGAIGVAKSISWFTENGYNVSISISETQRYDLIVEKYGILYKVEVKTTTNKYVSLRTNSPNYNLRNNHKTLTTEDADLLFVINSEGMFLIPVINISGMKEISPSKYSARLM